VSSNPPENNPLNIFGDTQRQDSTSELAPEKDLEAGVPHEDAQGEPEDALSRDLQAYDNPEVFKDATLPQTYRLKIRSGHVPDVPYILKIEIDGNSLPEVIHETMVWVMKQDPSFDGDIEALRTEIVNDDDYWNSVYSIRQFFVRHLPKLLIHAYNIAITTATFYEVGNLLDRRAERERLIKTILKELLRTLERDVKQMLATRSSGRPSVSEDRLPEIVKLVLRTAREIMGDAKGKDAVPVLKTIADRLDLTENALRKKLVRAHHPWAGIKHFLENQPETEN
jgi:hypothetical protein